MSIANPLWGAPRIHGELLKLGIDVGQTSVAKYMARRRGPPSQGWKTFLLSHADGIAAMDLFVVPTVSFRLLHGLLIMGHSRRRIMWLGVTAHPTAEWLANQLTQASGWGAPSGLPDPRPGCLLWQSVRSAGSFPRHSRSSDISAFALAERLCGALIGSIRRECLNRCRVRRAACGICCCLTWTTTTPLERTYRWRKTRLFCALCTQSAHPTTARPRWIAPSIYPDLIYGRDSHSFRQCRAATPTYCRRQPCR